MSDAAVEAPVPRASDDEPAGSAAEPRSRSRRGRGRRGRRKSSGRGRLVWWILGGALMLVAGLFFGIKIWIKGYLQSDKFRVWMNSELSQRAGAKVELDSIRWQDATAQVSLVSAEGGPGSPFTRLEARDVRAMVNTGAVWDRIWQVDEVKVARFFADLSPNRAAAEHEMPARAPAAPSDSSGFFASFLPNRTRVKGVVVDQAGFQWKSPEQSASARGIHLQIRPSEGNDFCIVEGEGGDLSVSALPDTKVEVRDLRLTASPEEIAVEECRVEAAGADVAVEGTVGLGDQPVLDLSADVSGLDIAKVEPEDWIKSLKGSVNGKVRVTGDPRQFAALAWSGDVQLKDGLLEGLPILHVIAKKTRNEAFIRLVLKDARAAFVRAGDGGWLVEKLTLDAPGLLRLKGNVSCAPDRALRGSLLLGIVPGTLRYVAGAEQQVFLPLNQLQVTQSERSLITADDNGLLWTRLELRGTLDHPQEDLADRLAMAWFNATVEQVMNMSVEDARKAAEAAGKLAAEAAGQVMEKAPELLENGLKTGSDLLQKGVEQGGGLLEKGVDGGLKTIEGLLPK